MTEVLVPYELMSVPLVVLSVCVAVLYFCSEDDAGKMQISSPVFTRCRLLLLSAKKSSSVPLPDKHILPGIRLVIFF